MHGIASQSFMASCPSCGAEDQNPGVCTSCGEEVPAESTDEGSEGGTE